MRHLASLAPAATLLAFALAPPPAHAQAAHPSRYPLRVHILAADTLFRTPRMAPGDSVACDSIGSITDATSPSLGGPISLSGVSGDPCSLRADLGPGASLDLERDFGYSGQGRADLVSPPAAIQGFDYRYSDCPRVRVPPGFQSLPARWKKPGRKLEVLVPADDIAPDGRPLPPARCTLTVTLRPAVYLRLRTGALVEVPEEEYWRHPAMRVFLSGGTPTIQDRVRQFTVSARPTK